MSRLIAWAQLLRLPNVFTALADVLAGFFAVGGSLAAAEPLWLLLVASACLYSAGMVLNDVFDFALDRDERPTRPLPSGRIGLGTARTVGFVLLAVGGLAGWAAGWFGGQLASGLVASGLALAVLAYDAWLRATPLGPVGMGLCRGLNVLLGMTGATAAAQPWPLGPGHALMLGGIGLYIVGVTVFSRQEATTSHRAGLAGGMLLIGLGLAALAALPLTVQGGLQAALEPRYAAAMGWRWYVLWAALGVLILRRCVVAWMNPMPQRVQVAVKQAILSLIVIDAAACLGFRDPLVAMLVIVLLVPATLLGRWIYST